MEQTVNYSILHPTVSDLPDIKRLYKQNRDTLSIPFSRIFDAMLVDENFWIIKSVDGELIGFCGIKLKPRKLEKEIIHLCVAEKFRRQHFASVLCKTCLLKFYQNKHGLFSTVDNFPVVAYAVKGAENNKFYDKLSTLKSECPKQTKILIRYVLDINKLLEA